MSLAANGGNSSERAAESLPAGRLVSVDALRGFDMFWIIGGRELLLAFAGLFASPAPKWLEYQLSHVPWESFSFAAWDLIMPLFLFVSGVSLPFSLAKWRGSGEGAGKFWLRLARRLALLWILGMMVQGNLLDWNLEKLRLYSNTLQAIAAGYLIAVILMLALPISGQIAATAGLLIGFWALLMYAPIPGQAAGNLDPWNNFAKYVDKATLGRFVDKYIYTWVLSSLGFGATVMMGALGGHILRADAPHRRKLQLLVGAGAGCLAAGWVWGYWHPFIKYIWTSTMNLWAGGWCYLLLAFFYGIIDVAGYRKWAFPLVVIGANAIGVYTATHLFDFEKMSDVFVGDLAPQIGAFGPLVRASGAVLLPWLILLYMYRKKTFIRV